MDSKIFRIVLTGGPCGGKSSSLAHLTEELENHGYRVFRIPEAATILFTGGVAVNDIGKDVIGFQTNLMRLQMHLEDTYYKQAKTCGEPSVLLIDRGVMDALGFIDYETWEALLDFNEWNEVALRDRRYDAVIHLVSAADGAQEFYTLENNPARNETVEDAKAVDHKLREAWLGHPHFRIIDNSTDFAEKLHRVAQAVFQVVGLPEPTECERKFLVSAVPDEAQWPVPFRDSEIEQTYLLSANPEQTIRVRKRGSNGSYTYTQTIKYPPKDGQRVEIEKNVRGRDYLNLLLEKDPDRQAIKKTRRTFLWKNHYFELDLFREPSDLILLEVELLHIDEEVELPPFLKIVREVTEEKEYQNSQLALQSA